MPLNPEAAQLVVGAAIVDARFCDRLLNRRAQALAHVNHLPEVPDHVRLTAEDRKALNNIPAATLAEFARGVERLRLTVIPGKLRRPLADEVVVG
jgi:hypothetical protein